MTVKFVDQKNLSELGKMELQMPPSEGQVVFLDDDAYCILRFHHGIYLKTKKRGKSSEEIVAYCKRC